MAKKKPKRKKLQELAEEVAVGAASGTIAWLIIELIKKLHG